MTKSFLPLIAVALIALIMTSGCILNDLFFPESVAAERLKAEPAAADFLSNYVRAELSTARWSEAESRNRMDYLFERCGPSTNLTDYYYIVFQEGSAVLEGWVFQRTGNVACVYRSDDQCVNDVSCEDGDLCTLDQCSGIPKECSRERIKECVGGDGCCPAGCTSEIDFDCEFDECESSDDCDDYDISTKNICSGIPRKCSYEEIVECETGDGYCPEGCSYSNDEECLVDECEADQDCDDQDSSTVDECKSEEGKPNLCSYSARKECISNDGFCPVHCVSTTDNDCVAEAGNMERIIVTCRGFKTNLNSEIKASVSGYLLANFVSVVNSSVNDGLKFYNTREFKYNGVGADTGLGDGTASTKNYSTMIERIHINATATYTPGPGGSKLSFTKNGLDYEVELSNGIPAIASEIRNNEAFVADNDDKIVIPLFGNDGLVTMVNQNEGEEEINILSDFTELSVVENGVAKNLVGKDGKTYTAKISRCDEESAIFNLYLDGVFVKGQEVKSGDIIFSDTLKKVTRINYLHKNSISKKCSFRYATGNYLEKIYHGKQFPFEEGVESDWKTYLEFENDRLKKIVFKNEAISTNPDVLSSESVLVLPQHESDGYGFCDLLFFGIVR